MYAILFDLDTNCLKDNYEEGFYNKCYQVIKKFMIENGFEWKQGSVYFGKKDIDAVKCVLTIQKFARDNDWFRTCVKDVRMLRIEENNDLSEAINFDI